jgi:hypothetical protein
VVVLASPFGRALVVVGVFFWLFLHAAASAISGAIEAATAGGIESPATSAINSLWVVAMTLVLLAVELRRKRLREFLAALGLSGVPLLLAALIAVGILEALLWVAMAIVEAA